MSSSSFTDTLPTPGMFHELLTPGCKVMLQAAQEGNRAIHDAIRCEMRIAMDAQQQVGTALQKLHTSPEAGQLPQIQSNITLAILHSLELRARNMLDLAERLQNTGIRMLTMTTAGASVQPTEQ
ncbi:Hypothetical protein RMHFA_00096 [Roseomonas mucosa]|mgnify:FL=1|uniref:Phasin domain-containing protein n=2 Tax=Roseomonas mucosa TaxID=207340 RepID=A0A1S8D2B0_9PROT|nr:MULTISPECIES: hypothetical protein [Roseomonas]MBS5904399.1 hypothetical protein [Acetobacteraceae bacterium]ATR21980.1 hypothetical protein CTJ15_17865 [Roseomonas sp. FDAARGOS_362]AWV21253.1 Hypothetical protein RADP37_00096 [Roseomonas mucosa]MCG7352223.1 hypothetical protein [Roseomonas mucosa]MCG7357545.1 hypothetical protein [Roseomonas mucosa]